ncbi:hypothetical protein DFH29DRAFT_192036 [Suillus ampliporus]|nr:hypothetical protein DFH29DRAFT_192036 [Suillus ampliporus]
MPSSPSSSFLMFSSPAAFLRLLIICFSIWSGYFMTKSPLAMSFERCDTGPLGTNLVPEMCSEEDKDSLHTERFAVLDGRYMTIPGRNIRCRQDIRTGARIKLQCICGR